MENIERSWPVATTTNKAQKDWESWKRKSRTLGLNILLMPNIEFIALGSDTYWPEVEMGCYALLVNCMQSWP